MNEKTINFTEGQTKLINYLVSSCGGFLGVKAKSGKNDAETTLNLLRAIEDQLRERHINDLLNESK